MNRKEIAVAIRAGKVFKLKQFTLNSYRLGWFHLIMLTKPLKSAPGHWRFRTLYKSKDKADVLKFANRVIGEENYRDETT